MPKRDSLGNSNLINGVNCLRSTVSKSNGAWKSPNPQVESEARRNQSVSCMFQFFLAGCNGIIRFTVVQQDVPPLLRVGMMRALQASLDLTDDGDKVIFRQFGRESSLRTLQSGHTVIRADQLIPMVGSFQKSRNWVRAMMKEAATHYMSVIAQVCQRPRCMDNDTSAGEHDPASTRNCRPLQKTTSDDNGLARFHSTIFPPHHFGSRVVSKRRVLFKTMSGIYGRAPDATSPGETRRHGTLWMIKQWKRLAHNMVYVRWAAFCDTLSREFWMLIPRPEDIRFAL